VCARYAEPLVENVRELAGHRKFLNETSQEPIESTLRAEKNPQNIPYRLCPTKRPAVFMLAYLPKTKIIREYVRVIPAGFVYRNNPPFHSVEKMLQWFKTHFKDPMTR